MSANQRQDEQQARLNMMCTSQRERLMRESLDELTQDEHEDRLRMISRYEIKD